MEYIGFLLGILIGISLGLIGGGGSILTIPVLVYIMGISPSNSTTYSLFIVGVATLIGSLKGIKDQMLNYRIAFFFGAPSIVSIFIMRKYIMPILPETFFSVANYSITKDLAIMIVFAILMIVASFSMIKKEIPIQATSSEINNKEIVLKGILVGVLTGFVGVGGGFLIIPTLLFSANLPMRKAVITSLLIITFNSLIGFIGSLNSDPIDWEFLLEFTAFAVVGILIGMYFSQKISNEKLKPIFGWFILMMGMYILIKEIFN